MRGPRLLLFWTLVFVAAGAGGVYLADQMVLAPGRALQRQLAEGDELKGKALLLLRRIFTDRRRPADGDTLDREGQMPQSYAAERAPTAFERELWARFWELANDPDEAQRRGVRALHGEAVSTRLRKDRVYTITLRSTGELTIQPTR